jgi:uncharacterized protein (TIGR03663 family)
LRWAAFLLIALAGFFLRIDRVGERPMHTDEAVNAYIVGQILAGNSFTYNPTDGHGPALTAFAMPLVRLQGATTFADLTESELRLVPALAGTVTILLFGAATEMFGYLPCIIAALLYAFAPLPVYYDRYFIHESLFCAATFGFILTSWRASHDSVRLRGYAANLVGLALAGACAALMLACKETAVIHLMALSAAAICFRRWISRDNHTVRLPGLAVALVVALLLSVTLYTWFGTNWRALTSSPDSLPHLFARAAGEGHQKPFWYYSQLLTDGWSGGILCALAAIGLLQSFRRGDSSPFGFLMLYAIFLAVLYSFIPYKTPWLALNLWLPLAFFAARAIVMLGRLLSTYLPKSLAMLPTILLILIISSGIFHDTVLRVFTHPADATNPYAYAHTSEDLLNLPGTIQQIAGQNAIAAPRIAVIAADPWPLPWYLRRFPATGFWRPDQQSGPADFYITSADAPIQDQWKDLHPDFFGLRPGVLIVLWSPVPK